MKMADFIHTLLNILAPYRCLNCGKRGALVCDSCASLLIPSPRYHHANLCTLFLYQEPLVKKLIWHLKYRGQKRVADYLVESLADTVVSEFSERSMIDRQLKQIVLIPIPTTKWQQLLRGGSQTAVLARSIYDKLKNSPDLNITIDSNLIKKIKYTKSQTKCRNLAERKSNLVGAFVAKPIDRPTAAQTLYIIIDDVLTSGTTLNTVAKALQKGGGRHIFQLAVAFQER